LNWTGSRLVVEQEVLGVLRLGSSTANSSPATLAGGRPVGSWELGSGQGSTNRRRELGLHGRGISLRLLEEGGATGRRRSSGGGPEVGGGWVRTLTEKMVVFVAGVQASLSRNRNQPFSGIWYVVWNLVGGYTCKSEFGAGRGWEKHRNRSFRIVVQISGALQPIDCLELGQKMLFVWAPASTAWKLLELLKGAQTNGPLLRSPEASPARSFRRGPPADVYVYGAALGRPSCNGRRDRATTC
jgi:hypothetical protein